MSDIRQPKEEVMKKWITRIILAVVALLVGFVAYVELNKESIASQLIDEASQDLKGTLTYEDIDVSLLSSFPRIGIGFDQLNITSAVSDIDDPLLLADKVKVEVDLMTAIKENEPIKIKEIHLDGVKLDLSVSEQGIANYNIYESEGTSSNEELDLDIESLVINNSSVRYTDHQTNASYQAENINSQSTINYRTDLAKIITELESDLTIDLGPVSPNYSIHLDGDTDLSMQLDLSEITVHEGNWKLNQLPLLMSGIVKSSREDYNYDLSIKSPSSEVKDILSLLPSIQQNEYERIVSKGRYAIDGKVSGSTADLYPQYDIALTIEDGEISLPDVSQNIESLDLTAQLTNQSARQPYTHMDIKDIDIKTGSSFLTGDIELTNRSLQQRADIDVKTDFSLQEIASSFMVDDKSEINGRLKGMIKANFEVSDDQEVNLGGEDLTIEMTSDGLSWRMDDQTMRIQELDIMGSGNKLTSTIKDMDYGSVMSDATIEMIIPQPLSLLYGETIQEQGSISITSRSIDMNTLSGDTTSSTLSYPIPPLKVNAELVVDTLIYDVYHIHDISGTGQIQETESTLSFSIGELNGGKFAGDASLQGLWSYVLNSDTLSGNLDLNSDLLDLQKYMDDGTDTEVVTTEISLAPGNLDIDINYDVDAIKYGKIDILKSLGNIGLEEGNVTIESQGNLLGGNILFSAVLDADQKDKYHLNLDLKVTDLGLKETAQKLNTVTKILPIASLLEGSYDAVLKWESDLDLNYLPDLNTLTAYGEVFTKDGKLLGNIPGQEYLDNFISSSVTKAVDIASTKNYFFIKDGRVAIQDIVLEKDDIKIEIGGSHGLNNDLMYDLKIDVPKEKWRGVGDAVTQAAKKWTDKIGLSDISEDLIFEVNGNLIGSITNPKIEVTNVRPVSGESGQTVQDIVKSEVNAKIDSVQTVVTDTIRVIENTIRERIDSTKNVVLDKVDSTKKAIEEVADSTIMAFEDLIAQETQELEQEGAALLDSLKNGNVDSVLSQIKILLESKGKKLEDLKLPDNIKKKLPIFSKKSG